MDGRGRHAQYAPAQRYFARLDQGRQAEAEALLAEAWSFVEREHGGADWRNGETPIVYGLALSAAGRRSQAKPLLRAGVEAIASRRRADDPLLRRAREAG